MVYKTAIFDLGNVLVFFDQARIIAQLKDCTGLSQEELQTLLTTEQPRYETGKINNETLYHLFRKLSPRTFSPAEFYYAITDIFTPNHAIDPMLHALKEKGHRLVLLSNTNAAHYEFLVLRMPILEIFDAKILSYEIGSAKPDPQIYHAAIKASHCHPEECFYTDDIPEYIAAAKIHAIDAEIFTDVSSLQKHLRSRRLL